MLLLKALAKFLCGVIIVFALIFVPAGTVLYFQGLLLLFILFVPMLILGIVLLIKNPQLLEKRLNGNEKQAEQKPVLLCSALMFIAGFLLSGLGFRFGWYLIPRSVSCVFAFVFLGAYLLYAEVMRENAYLSRTVEVQRGQRVIDTGLYGIVRHPMYSVTLLLFLSMPLVLGSLYAFIVFLIYPVLIVKRIKAEEELLERELDGYCEYKKKVKYRLIPFVW